MLFLAAVTVSQVARTKVHGPLFSLCLPKDKKKYLDIIHSYMEVHGTVHGTSTVHLPSYVKNHGILSGRDLQFLLRETKVSQPGCKRSLMKDVNPAGEI